MPTLRDLEKFRKMEEYNKTELVDIGDIKIDTSQPIDKRLKNFLLHIKNPYFFKCNGVPVVVSYANNGVSLSEKIQEHFIRQKQQ